MENLFEWVNKNLQVKKEHKKNVIEFGNVRIISRHQIPIIIVDGGIKFWESQEEVLV